MSKEEMKLPAPTSSSCVESLYEWLREEILSTSCGKIGLEVTIHEAKIVKFRKIKELSIGNT